MTATITMNPIMVSVDDILFFQLSSAHVYSDCLTTITKFTFHAHFVDMSELEDVIFWKLRQESRAAARKPRDASTVLFGLKFANNI